MSVSNLVSIQKRTVYDILTMFGDVGGLRDFLSIGFSTCLALVSERMMLASIIESLFHVSLGTS